MRCGSLVLLMLLGVLVHSRDLCPGGTLSTKVIDVSTAGQYDLKSCSLHGLILLSAEGIAQGYNAAVTLNISENKINAVSTLQIQAPSYSAAPTCAPLTLFITSNKFSEASFRFQGSLPPHSTIIFARNNMTATEANPFSGLSVYALGLVVIASSSPISLFENSSLIILENVLSISTSTALRGYLIVFTSFTLETSAFINIRNNTMNLVLTKPAAPTAAFAIFLQSNGDVIGANPTLVTFAGSFSSFSIERNIVEIKSSGVAALLVGYTLQTIDTFGGTNLINLAGATLTVADNIISIGAKTETTTGILSFSGEVKLNHILFRANNVSKNVSITLLRFSTLSLLPKSVLDFSHNVIHRTNDSIMSRDIIQTVSLLVPVVGDVALINVSDNTFIFANLSSNSRVLRTYSTAHTTSKFILFSRNFFSWLPGSWGREAELYSDQLSPNIIVLVSLTVPILHTKTAPRHERLLSETQTEGESQSTATYPSFTKPLISKTSSSTHSPSMVLLSETSVTATEVVNDSQTPSTTATYMLSNEALPISPSTTTRKEMSTSDPVSTLSESGSHQILLSPKSSLSTSASKKVSSAFSGSQDLTSTVNNISSKTHRIITPTLEVNTISRSRSLRQMEQTTSPHADTSQILSSSTTLEPPHTQTHSNMSQSWLTDNGSKTELSFTHTEVLISGTLISPSKTILKLEVKSLSPKRALPRLVHIWIIFILYFTLVW